MEELRRKGKKTIVFGIILMLVSTGCISSFGVVIANEKPTSKTNENYRFKGFNIPNCDILVDDIPSSGPGNPPENFTNIQEAIDYASDDDTICVFNGTYNENININKRIKLVGGKYFPGDNDRNGSHIIADDTFENTIYISTNNVNVSGFIIRKSDESGIFIDSNYCNIYSNIIRNTLYGIKGSCSNITISKNEIINNHKGMDLTGSNNKIIRNIINDTGGAGIEIDGSDNTINNNFIIDHNYGNGIEIRGTNNMVIGNSIERDEPRSYAGISLFYSSYCELKNNNFDLEGIRFYGNLKEHYNSHIIENNNANGRPIRYYKNMNNEVVPQNTSQLIIANCEDFSVENLNITDINIGTQIFYSYNIDLTNNEFKNVDEGITLLESERIHISKNNFFDNGEGIFIEDSHDNTISNNVFLNNNIGIKLTNTYDCSINNNNISGCSNNYGIYLEDTNKNDIHNNNIFDNYGGIISHRSNDNRIYENLISNNEVQGVYIISLDGSYSQNNVIENNEIIENDIGLSLRHTQGNFIKLNNFTDNELSIKISNSWLDRITDNNLLTSDLNMWANFSFVIAPLNYWGAKKRHFNVLFGDISRDGIAWVFIFPKRNKPVPDAGIPSI